MSTWPKEHNLDKAVKFILFLISPTIAFLYSLRTIKTKSSYVVFFLAALFFGMAFTVESGKTDDVGIDGASYREKFDRYIHYGEYLYYERLNEYLSFDKGDKDFYFDTVAFFTSKVTHNYHVMFLIFAMVFAYFALKSFRFLTTETKFVTSYACFLLAFLFMNNQIFNINGLRFWTAAWIGVYSIFQIFRKDNRKYFLLALCTPFIHGAFWLFLLVLIIAYFNQKKHNTWVILFYISFGLSFISVELMRISIDYLPNFLQNMALAYTNEEYIEELGSKSNAYFYVSQFFSYALKIYINVMVLLFIKNANQITANPKTAKLFSFLLVWMSFVNFVAPIPSLGGRFLSLALPIIAYIWLVNFKGVKYKKYLQIMPFVFAFKIYLLYSLYSEVLDFKFYISSPFYLIYKYLIVA